MSKTFAQCRKCGHKEEVNKEFFFKIIGGGVTGGGFWAWTAYIFAGTGFALPIVLQLWPGEQVQPLTQKKSRNGYVKESLVQIAVTKMACLRYR